MSDATETKPAPAPAKGKKGKKDKKDKKKGAAGKGSGFSVASHPRAAGAVRRAKGFGGLVGFALAALLAHRAGLSVTQTVERALIAGVAGYLIAWACAVTVWRQILVAQLRTAAAAQRAAAPPARRSLPISPAAEGAGESAAAPGE